MKRFIFIFVAVFALSASNFAQNSPKYNSRVLLVPLDDRPPCLQFTVEMGKIGDAEVVSPPKELLGRFTVPGDADKIVEWLKTQDLKSFDAAIIALDMTAYGGLVAMRRYGDTTAETALRRIEVLREMKKRAPKLPVYAQSVIMRLAPTGDGRNDAYRDKLSRWAEISPYAESKTETTKLEREIPAEVLKDYQAARERDLKVNLKAIDLTRAGVIDYLILSQDDAKPKGIHVADRERLIAETQRLKLTEKIAVQPGADEVSMLLLARATNDLHKISPHIKAIYSSEELSNKAMPYEDRALRETVSFHIKATGAREVASEKDADLLFYVYASRFENGRAASFAEEIAAKIKQGKRIIVADVDPKGDVQGGDPQFTTELGRRGVFPELYGYAAWNTAGNTIGTTLPQAVVFAAARLKLMKSSAAAANRIWTAQNWFTFHRILDDYYYHTEVRAKAKEFIAQNKWSSLRLTDEATQKVEDFSAKLMRDSFAELTAVYFRAGGAAQQNVRCGKTSNMSFDLPWNRTFEAEIDFDLQCAASAQN